MTFMQTRGHKLFGGMMKRLKPSSLILPEAELTPLTHTQKKNKQ